MKTDVLSILNKIPSLLAFKNVQIQTSIDTDYVTRQRVTEKWIKRKISNFECLFFLDDVSGRSVSDAAIYPVFSRILKYAKNRAHR
jgi:hypothetical protein